MCSGHWRAWAAAAKRSVGATLPLSLLTLLIWLTPGLSQHLQLNAGGARAGEFWRVLTCHFTHWSSSHLMWDLGMFALLGMLCEQRSHLRFAACLGSALVAIPVVVGWAHPELTYRGLSGLDSALFGLLAALIWRERATARDPFGVATAILMLIGFCAKITYECLSAQTVFASGDSMVPVPLAHVVGVGVGFAFGMASLPCRMLSDLLPGNRAETIHQIRL